MLYVGTDEAGYGPLLGPLIVAGSVFVSEGARSRIAAAGAEDSKVAYARGGRGALARVLGRYWDQCASLTDILAQHSVCGDPRAAYPWYGDVEASDLTPGRRSAAFRRLLVNPVCESAFNRGCDAWGNKAGVLFAETMRVIRAALTRWPDQDADITCDKHGGRNRYAALLLVELGPTQLVAERESAALSSYRLQVGGRTVRIRFLPKADAGDAPVALASMAAKYVRELFMHGFNDYFTARVEGLKRTAGYYGDGRRFLRDVAPILDSIEGGAAALVRCR